MPEPIPDTPEAVARALMTSPPRKPGEWEYLKPAPKPPTTEQPDAD